MDAKDWFRKRQLTPDLTVYDEPFVDSYFMANMFHLVGRDRDLVALAPAADELAEHLGRVLQVTVHDDHGPAGRMLRSEHHKYTVYSEGQRREALVDLRKDPGEMVNLAGKSEHAEVLQQHRTLLANWCRQYGDKFPVVS